TLDFSLHYMDVKNFLESPDTNVALSFGSEVRIWSLTAPARQPGLSQQTYPVETPESLHNRLQWRGPSARMKSGRRSGFRITLGGSGEAESFLPWRRFAPHNRLTSRCWRNPELFSPTAFLMSA